MGRRNGILASEVLLELNIKNVSQLLKTSTPSKAENLYEIHGTCVRYQKLNTHFVECMCEEGHIEMCIVRGDHSAREHSGQIERHLAKKRCTCDVFFDYPVDVALKRPARIDQGIEHKTGLFIVRFQMNY